MSSETFVSYAQNGEDVVLWRALRSVPAGRYVDVGANDPDIDSVTRALYERGWSGLDVEPVAACADALRKARPRDSVAEVAVARAEGQRVLHEFSGTGLSTLRDDYVAQTVEQGHAHREVSVPARTLQSLVDEHLAGEQVHFLKVDVEGAEAEVLASADLRRWRPWVLVVEATRPNSPEQTHAEWEPDVLAAGYRFCQFDGLSRWYVADEHADELAPLLSYPACPLDRYATAATREAAREVQQLRDDATRRQEEGARELAALRAEADQLRSELVRWRGAVLEHWSRAVAPARVVGDDDARAELEAVRRTVSWRVTRPLRALRARVPLT